MAGARTENTAIPPPGSLNKRHNLYYSYQRPCVLKSKGDSKKSKRLLKL